jgi:hypothetical protein
VDSVGGKPATIGQATVVPPGNFQVKPDSCSAQPLAPGHSCQLTVTFTPPSDSPSGTVFEAVLQIPSDAASDPDVVKLTGTVDPPPRPERALLVKPRDLPFVGAAGSESLPRFVEVQSIGKDPVTITGADRRGTDPDAFALDDAACRSTPLGPGATCILTVTFKPQTANTAYAADLVVIADADGDKTVKLTGRSQEDQPDLIPARTYQLSPDKPAVIITVANRGGAASELTSVRLDAPGFDRQTRDLVALPPKTSTRISFDLPPACSDSCRLTVTVDDGDRVREANERNNSWTYLISTGAAQSAGRYQTR